VPSGAAKLRCSASAPAGRLFPPTHRHRYQSHTRTLRDYISPAAPSSYSAATGRRPIVWIPGGHHGGPAAALSPSRGVAAIASTPQCRPRIHARLQPVFARPYPHPRDVGVSRQGHEPAVACRSIATADRQSARTVDELVIAGEAGRPKLMIVSSSGIAMAALVPRLGAAEPPCSHIARDDNQAVEDRIAAGAARSADPLLAAPSVATTIWSQAALQGPGFMPCSGRIAMRPGKPRMFSRTGKSASSLGMPCNPVSTWSAPPVQEAPLGAHAGPAGRHRWRPYQRGVPSTPNQRHPRGLCLGSQA